MTPEDRKIFREAILAQLMRMRPGRLTIATLKNGVSAAGFTVSEAELESELEYLADKQFVTFEQDELGGGNKWKIRSDGVNYCERNAVG